MIYFALPDAFEGTAEAEIIAWHVAAGQTVAEDQALVDIQTDKAIVQIPCPAAGVIVELCAEAGDVIPIGAPLVVIDDGLPQRGQPHGTQVSPGVTRATDHDAREPAAAQSSPDNKPLASPVVRRLARELGVSLAGVAGTGPEGRITVHDVEALGDLSARCEPQSASASEALTRRDGSADQTLPLTTIRRTIARTLTHAWQTIPHITDYREVDFTELAGVRHEMKLAAEAADDQALSRALTFTPFLVKLVCVALEHHPRLNASLDMESAKFTMHAAKHVGIATATPHGLMVPVVRDADQKSVSDLALEIGRLVAAGRERRLRSDELTGGTITVNNYGALGVWLGTPIIKPPEVANIGFGRITDRVVVRGGEMTIKPISVLAVAGDHQLVDGDVLAAFAGSLVELIEAPDLALGSLH